MMLETMDSKSYPGILCVYRTHYIQIEILEAGLHLFEGKGLPGGEDFETSETSKAGTKVYKWGWVTVEEALETKVKGLLTESTAGIVQLDYKETKAWNSLGLDKIEQVDELRKALEL